MGVIRQALAEQQQIQLLRHRLGLAQLALEEPGPRREHQRAA